MTPLLIRPLEDRDAEGVLSLWNRGVRYDRMTPELFEEKIYEDPNYMRELVLVAEEQNRLLGFIAGTLRPLAEGGATGFVKLLVVEPSHRRHGVGSRLLTTLEAELKQRDCRLVRVFESAPNYLLPGIDPRYTEALAFFEQRGYERFGETANMEADLHAQNFDTSAEEAKLREQGFEIRRAIMGDKDYVRALLQQHWAAWIPEVERTLLNYPISLHLAWHNHKVVAFSAYDGNNLNTGWFGPMGTDPAYRGSGLGGILLKRCLADIKAQGHRLAIIPWIGPYRFYAHHSGANIARVFWRYRKNL
ncbi:GNAT family N-acetyltransferase [candidate division KSB1 bacterium]|nr:GNAT family N-acetyltransferase [candidate division KSB1 bacterium]